MKSLLPRAGLACTCLMLIAGVVTAQQPRRDAAEDYRRYFKKPETAEEFWEAIRFEINVGRYDLAAQHLRSLLAKKPTPEELVQLYEKHGIAPFLRLRLLPRWSEDAAVEREARQNVNTLIEQITEAARKKLSDPNRIKLFVRNLLATPEEAAYALRELAKSGAVAVPYLIEELRILPVSERGPILDAMSRLGPETVPPVLAALDIPDEKLRENLIDVLRGRPDFIRLKSKGMDPAPFLWPLASPAEKSVRVRENARQALATLYGLDAPSKLPLARNELTREAERYYYHRVPFADPNQVTVWRWDGQKLVADNTFTASEAEEHYGLRFARQALDIDAAYRPAQIVFLSLVLDKGYEKRTPEDPVGTLKPSVQELVAKVNPNLLVAVLERALRDERTPVVLAAVQALGKLGDVRAVRPGAEGQSALVRALNYGDRRVQFAAADAILSIPGPPPPEVATRIVDILKGTLSPDAAASAKPRVLVAFADERLRNAVARTVAEIGAESVLAATGRAALRRLLRRADIDAVLLDSTLPDPGLPSFLAQMRAAQGLNRLPVLLAAVPESREARALLRNIGETQANIAAITGEIDRMRARRLGRPDLLSLQGGGRPDERVIADAEARRADLQRALRNLTEDYGLVSRRREDQLRRYVERERNVRVVSPSELTGARYLQVSLEDTLKQAGMPPLTQAERKKYVEGALAWLARMASGEVKGFDVRPAADAVYAVLQGAPVSERATVNALRVVGRIPGPEAQKQMINVLLDGNRPVPVRVAAADELQRHVQVYGRPEPEQEQQLREGLRTELGKANLDPLLRARLSLLVGNLRPDEKSTGQRLRDFRP